MREEKELKKGRIILVYDRTWTCDLKSAREQDDLSKETRIKFFYQRCVFFFILNEKKCILPKKKKKLYIDFYISKGNVQIFVYCVWEIFTSYVVIYIRRYIKRARDIDESNTFYVTCNRLHPSSTPLYKIFQKPQFTYESFILYTRCVYIKFRIFK